MSDLFQLLTPVAQGTLSTQEVLTRLKFIGTIQPGEKLNVSSLKIEQASSYIAPIKRYLYNESRQETYNFVYNIIEQAFVILFTLAPSAKISDNMVCSNIIQDLHQALQGVKSLQETYKDDKMFVCELETLIQAVESKILEARQKHPDLRAAFDEPRVIRSPSITTATPAPSPALAPLVEPSSSPPTAAPAIVPVSDQANTAAPNDQQQQQQKKKK